MTHLLEAYRELAGACHARARERDDAQGRVLDMQIEDHERRCEIAKLVGMQEDDGLPPQWPALMTRLREAITTFRLTPRLPNETPSTDRL